MDDHEFNQLLERRHVPDAPSNLASRIIEASKAQKRPVPFYLKMLSPLKDVGQWFASPQPALAFATVAVLSVVGLGFYNSDITTVEQPNEYYSEAEEVELAFYLDDVFEMDY